MLCTSPCNFQLCAHLETSPTECTETSPNPTRGAASSAVTYPVARWPVTCPAEHTTFLISVRRMRSVAPHAFHNSLGMGSGAW